MEDAHAKSISEVTRFFETGPDGLTEEQVRKLREQYGLNGESFSIYSLSFNKYVCLSVD